ncbi:MAG: DsrE family protein [Salinigranum sp.]
MTPTIFPTCTHGKDDPERATLPYVVGNVAASAGQAVTVLLTIDGVWTATEGYADEIHEKGFQPLREVIASFVSNGGEIWACGACTAPRGITEGDLIDGAKIVTAATVVEVVTEGAVPISF